MKNPLSSYQAVCRPGSGAGAFFASILVWGVGIGCFAAAFNNFLVETYDINGFDRGLLEFLRETPGVLLVAIFAALGRFSAAGYGIASAPAFSLPLRRSWPWQTAHLRLRCQNPSPAPREYDITSGHTLWRALTFALVLVY